MVGRFGALWGIGGCLFGTSSPKAPKSQHSAATAALLATHGKGQRHPRPIYCTHATNATNAALVLVNLVNRCSFTLTRQSGRRAPLRLLCSLPRWLTFAAAVFDVCSTCVRCLGPGVGCDAVGDSLGYAVPPARRCIEPFLPHCHHNGVLYLARCILTRLAS